MNRRGGVGLTVVLFDSPPDWEPWATAPFDICPPANTTADNGVGEKHHHYKRK